MPFILQIVTNGTDKAIEENPGIRRGVGTHHGEIYHISSLSPLAQAA
jgi:alanine dehydrogenase